MTRPPVLLKPEPLTQAAFSPFGTVIEKAGAEQRVINEGTCIRFHNLAHLDVADMDGAATLSIFQPDARPVPIEIEMMERHPLGSQAFFPLADYAWLIVVSDAVRPTADSLKAFRARGDQGVQYAKGVWHHPLLVVRAGQNFLVADRSGPGENLEEVRFPEGAGALLSPL